MFVLNETTGRYEAIVGGSFISVSARRIEDDIYNRAAIAAPTDKEFPAALIEKRAFILANPQIYHAKGNGWSVIVARARK